VVHIIIIPGSATGGSAERGSVSEIVANSCAFSFNFCSKILVLASMHLLPCGNFRFIDKPDKFDFHTADLNGEKGFFVRG